MANPAQPPFQNGIGLNRDEPSILATRQGIDNDLDSWCAQLEKELKTAELDDLYDYLWLVSKKDGTHIDPLHEQVIKKRAIIVTEHPRLHLIWFKDTIYLKPIPDFLFCRTIWTTCLCATTADQQANPDRTYLRQAALGFLRSYGLLIQHESDYTIAKEANLIPKGVGFVNFQKFIKDIRRLSDADVAKRYHYGQLRLSYLNYAVLFFRPPFTQKKFCWSYQNQYWSTAQYLQRFGAPLAFAFVIVSVILSAMQVMLAALGETVWGAFTQVSWGFSVTVIALAASPIVLAVLIAIGVLVFQGQYALRQKLRDGHGNGAPQALP